MSSKYERRPNADLRHATYNKEKRGYDTFSKGLRCSCGEPRSNHSVSKCRTCLIAFRKLEGVLSGGHASSTSWFDDLLISDLGELVIIKTRLHGDLA